MVSGERTTLAHGVFSGTGVPAASPKGVPSRYAIVAAPSASHRLALGSPSQTETEKGERL